MNWSRFALLLALTDLWPGGSRVRAASPLEEGFVHPPDSARPWVYWFWLNGNITSNGITADLEAMQRVGIGGVLIMEVDPGSAGRARGLWQGRCGAALFKHVCTEAHRLGLEVNMNNDAGWCGSGGPWITPEQSMQKVVWTETDVTGRIRSKAPCPNPRRSPASIATLRCWLSRRRSGPHRRTRRQGRVSPLAVSLAPPAIARRSRRRRRFARIDGRTLTGQMDQAGRFAWDVPPGDWTILRFGHTSTGRITIRHPRPAAGLECDKLSTPGSRSHVPRADGQIGRGYRAPAGARRWCATHIDSWEVGSQNWTPACARNSSGAAAMISSPFLPVITGRVVDSLEISERFLWDLRQTVSELVIENYAGHMRELAHAPWAAASRSKPTAGPCDDIAYASQCR